VISYDSLSFRTWSKLGQRGAFAAVSSFEIVRQVPNSVIVTADLGFLSGLDRFKEKYPDRFFNVGIAEQNMVGVSAGLAQEGMTVFATTYATFVTMRSCEQVRHFLGYMRSNVKIVGSGAGLVMGYSGNTHYTFEDIAMMRVIPNIVVLSPADAAETVKATIAAANYSGPVYIRLTGGLNVPMVYKGDYDFEIGKNVVLKPDGDVAIFATGTVTHNAMQAASELARRGVQARVVNVHTIKPLDVESVLRESRQCKLLVSVEEHSCLGGLGGALSEVLAAHGSQAPLLRLGISDQYHHAGDHNYLLGLNGLLPEQIAQSVFGAYSQLD